MVRMRFAIALFCSFVGAFANLLPDILEGDVPDVSVCVSECTLSTAESCCLTGVPFGSVVTEARAAMSSSDDVLGRIEKIQVVVNGVDASHVPVYLAETIQFLTTRVIPRLFEIKLRLARFSTHEVVGDIAKSLYTTVKNQAHRLIYWSFWSTDEIAGLNANPPSNNECDDLQSCGSLDSLSNVQEKEGQDNGFSSKMHEDTKEKQVQQGASKKKVRTNWKKQQYYRNEDWMKQNEGRKKTQQDGETTSFEMLLSTSQLKNNQSTDVNNTPVIENPRTHQILHHLKDISGVSKDAAVGQERNEPIEMSKSDERHRNSNVRPFFKSWWDRHQRLNKDNFRGSAYSESSTEDGSFVPNKADDAAKNQQFPHYFSSSQHAKQRPLYLKFSHKINDVSMKHKRGQLPSDQHSKVWPDKNLPLSSSQKFKSFRHAEKKQNRSKFPSISTDMPVNQQRRPKQEDDVDEQIGYFSDESLPPQKFERDHSKYERMYKERAQKSNHHSTFPQEIPEDVSLDQKHDALSSSHKFRRGRFRHAEKKQNRSKFPSISTDVPVNQQRGPKQEDDVDEQTGYFSDESLRPQKFEGDHSKYERMYKERTQKSNHDSTFPQENPEDVSLDQKHDALGVYFDPRTFDEPRYDEDYKVQQPRHELNEFSYDKSQFPSNDHVPALEPSIEKSLPQQTPCSESSSRASPTNTYAMNELNSEQDVKQNNVSEHSTTQEPGTVGSKQDVKDLNDTLNKTSSTPHIEHISENISKKSSSKQHKQKVTKS